SLQIIQVNNSNLSVSATTDANGHYTISATAAVYYLRGLSGHINSPLNSNINFVNWYSLNDTTHTLRFDLSNSDITQNFVIPYATLNVTVKDGAGNLVPNAPVTINTFAGDVALTAGATPG